MGRYSDHQCIADPSGGIEQKSVGKYAGIPCLFDNFSVFSGVMGLILSYYTNVANLPMIVIIASVIYFVTYFSEESGKNNRENRI